MDFRATHLRSDPIAYYRFFSRFVYPNQEALTRDEPVRCLSAFNGLCVYRFADVLRASYVADNDFTECEHVWFHRSLGRLTGQPMVIDPSLVVAMPAEHGRRDFASFWLQRLVRLDRLLG